VRFGLWDEVLGEAAPPEDLPYMRALSHAARGLAHAARGQLNEAAKEEAALAALKDDPSLKMAYISSANFASSIVAVAHEVLAGEIAAKRRRTDEAMRRYAAAVKLEDALIYMEPPDWPIPVRQLQGAALLELGRVKEAEAAFREDMRKFPDNGWSLSGLQTSLTRQNRAREAEEVGARFREKWRLADIELVAARPRQP
jgi:tetratricopeptide (TPR) repeat protein